MPLTKQNVRAFLDRDWQLARSAKDEAMGRYIRSHGLEAALRLEQMLVDQGWPLLPAAERHRDDSPGLIEMGRRLGRG